MRRSLSQAQRNVMDGVSMAQSADQGVQQLQAIVSRLREHAVRASSSHHSAQTRQILNDDYKTLLTSYDRIVNTLNFNGKSLLGPGVETEGLPQIQIGAGGGVSSRMSMALSDLSLRRMGRVDPLAGASVVSSAPLAVFTIDELPAEAALTIGGPFGFEDTATITGSASGPFNIDGVAQIDMGAGPYTFNGAAERVGSKTGPFTIPPAPRIFGTDAPTFDVVEGENDILRLRVDGVDRSIQLAAGFQSLSGIVNSINGELPGVAGVEDGALVLRASGEVASLRVSSGSALTMLGLSAGATSTGQNSVVFSTPEGSFNVTFDEGTHSTTDIVSAINAVKPGAAEEVGGRLKLSAQGGQTFMSVGGGSANGILGLSAGTTRSTDNFRYRVNFGGWQSIDLPDGTLSADQLASQINDRTPGIASVVGGSVRLRSDTGASQIHIGSGTANGVLGVSTGQQDTGENLISIQVNGVSRSTTLASGTYSASQMADVYNGLFDGVASVDGGRIKLSATGSGASLHTGASSVNGVLGIPNGANARARNILQFRVDGGAMQSVAFTGGALSADQVAEQINAVIPGLAQAEGGGVVLRSEGPGSSIRVGNGSANSLVGLVNGQTVSTPTQGRDLIYSVNGEPTTVHLDPGTYTPQDVLGAINGTRPGFATLLDDGRLRLATQSVGTVNTVTIGAGSLNSDLGLSSGQSGTGIDTDSLALTSLESPEQAQAALASATKALNELSGSLADIGAFLNTSDTIADGLGTQILTSEIARSRIEDADFAREAAEMVKADIASNTAASLMGAIREMERTVTALFDLVGA